VHWGIHFIPKVVADYERRIAESAFLSGADVILGHHAHLPKAIGIYEGKVCFHGLGNFIMSIPDPSPVRVEQMYRDYGVHPDEQRPRLPFGPDAKHSLLARIRLTKNEVRSVSFHPVLIDEDMRPEALTPADPRFGEEVAYMEWASEGFVHKFCVQGREVTVS
jgi:poly-gamma-glutamate synthesis protein (capsule biosynthesis protein)